MTNSNIAITNAHLITNTGVQSAATAVLIKSGTIVAVGDNLKIEQLAKQDNITVFDVSGATVTPGLFDSHTHPHWAVSLTSGLDLGGIKNITQLRAVLKAEHEKLPPDAWLIAWNLEFEVFAGLQVHADLIEEAVDGRPVAIMFYDLHTGFGTRAALEAAGITGPREFADLSEIKIGADGRPTGELSEPSAYKILFDAVPPRNREAEREALRQMFARFTATGLTGIAVMDGSPLTKSLVQELEERKELDLRVTIHQWHGVGDDDSIVAKRIAEMNERGALWRSDAIKLFSDGVIDTGTALLHEPDTCGQSTKGFWLDWDRYREVVRKYHDAGMLIATHAVGDAAVAEVAKVYASLPDRPGLPFHSIEHLEVLSDQDIELLKGSGITASMQPLHMQWRSAENDDSWAARLGDPRWSTGFRVRDVADAGIRLVLGSDWPVAQYDPRIGMAWARARQNPGEVNAPVFEPEQRLSGEEALLAYTLWPALARGALDHGKIEPGFVGDLTVWQADPTSVKAAELIDVPILMTVLAGRVTHSSVTL